MLGRSLYNFCRGVFGSELVYPIAEWTQGRTIREKQAAVADDASRNFAERKARAWKRLVETVEFAGARVPYYRDLFHDIGFDPASLHRSAGYLADIPALTKDIIREQGERLLRDDHASYRTHASKTGGSTGPSAVIMYDQDAADWTSGVIRYARERIGAGATRSEVHFSSHFDGKITFRDKLREQLKCIANNRFNIAFASFAPAQLETIWQRLCDIRPHLVHGHPSTLYQLALHMSDRTNGIRPFRVFESSGETLDSKQRDVIRRTFHCDIIDRYGLAEAGVVAYQIDPARSEMLVLDGVVWPEIVDVGFANDVAGEQPRDAHTRAGELVITTLKNWMMPLLRYRTGDIAVLRQSDDGFFIQDLLGRIHDVVEIGGVPVPTHHVQDILDRIGQIREFQIDTSGARPLFRVVPESGEAVVKIGEKLRQRWGDSIDIEFIDASALTFRGWRSKFHHLIAPPQI
jgi:phenylacetate-CoA ligase